MRRFLLTLSLGRAYQVDVRSQTHVSQVIDEIVREFNCRLDIFVANAGIPWSQGSFLDGEIEHYKNVMSTDMDSVYYCAYAAGLHWRRQKLEGTVAARNGLKATPDQLAGWLDGVTTMDGKDGLAAVKGALGL